MTEFAGAVETKLTALPPAAPKSGLLSEAKAFRGLVARKAAPDDVAKAARSLATHLLATYSVPLAPGKVRTSRADRRFTRKTAPAATASMATVMDPMRPSSIRCRWPLPMRPARASAVRSRSIR
jgi:hypothetical protein